MFDTSQPTLSQINEAIHKSHIHHQSLQINPTMDKPNLTSVKKGTSVNREADESLLNS
jgi:hypothetical protein